MLRYNYCRLVFPSEFDLGGHHSGLYQVKGIDAVIRASWWINALRRWGRILLRTIWGLREKLADWIRDAWGRRTAKEA